ncbi:MAG TPA: tripartite tricarboxylate transporter TctB family protein [Thermodesulfobacteriota bacterium]|nr:tripartite tricarboxylate transporter TctB family protein [Thermodesulfobacteriota bacterium]
MNKYDRVSGLIWLGLAVYICVEAVRLPLGSWRDPGPGFLPLGAGLGLALLSVVDLLRSNAGTAKAPPGPWYSRERWKAVVLILLSLVAYSFLLDTLGFLVTTFLFLMLLFRFVEPQPWKIAIGGSALASVAAYVIFEVWLKTQLPPGILGF